MEIKQIIRGLIRESLNEAVEISHSRYMRSHGKKASGNGTWMFTTKEMGEPSDKEMVSVSGTVSDAGREAAKKLKTNRVYVMEEVELNEALASDYAGMLGKFKKAVDKAEESKSKGDNQKMSKHLEDARNRLFGMKSTDSAKLKNTDHYERYNKMKGLKESDILDEVAIIKNGRKYANARRFDTDKEANAFLEKNPEYGVLHADSGGVYVAKNRNKGTPVK